MSLTIQLIYTFPQKPMTNIAVKPDMFAVNTSQRMSIPNVGIVNAKKAASTGIAEGNFYKTYRKDGVTVTDDMGPELNVTMLRYFVTYSSKYEYTGHKVVVKDKKLSKEEIEAKRMSLIGELQEDFPFPGLGEVDYKVYTNEIPVEQQWEDHGFPIRFYYQQLQEGADGNRPPREEMKFETYAEFKAEVKEYFPEFSDAVSWTPVFYFLLDGVVHRYEANKSSLLGINKDDRTDFKDPQAKSFTEFDNGSLNLFSQVCKMTTSQANQDNWHYAQFEKVEGEPEDVTSAREEFGEYYFNKHQRNPINPDAIEVVASKPNATLEEAKKVFLDEDGNDLTPPETPKTSTIKASSLPF